MVFSCKHDPRMASVTSAPSAIGILYSKYRCKMFRNRQSCKQRKAPQSLRTSTQALAATGAGVAQATASNTGALLISVGIFLLGAALAALALAAIPAVLEMRRTARQLQLLALALEQEIPDTASSMRLTGLELSDAIQEVSMLGNDVTQGLRASARMLQEAEGGVKQGVSFIQTTATGKVLPALRSHIPLARGTLEERLRKNTQLSHTEPTLLQLATATKVTARRIRFALLAANLVGRAKAVTDFLSIRAEPGRLQ